MKTIDIALVVGLLCTGVHSAQASPAEATEALDAATRELATQGARRVGDAPAKLVEVGTVTPFVTPVLNKGGVYAIVLAGCSDAVVLQTVVTDLDGNALVGEAWQDTRFAVEVFSVPATGVYLANARFAAGMDRKAHVRIGLFQLPSPADESWDQDSSHGTVPQSVSESSGPDFVAAGGLSALAAVGCLLQPSAAALCSLALAIGVDASEGPRSSGRRFHEAVDSEPFPSEAPDLAPPTGRVWVL